jgi:carboxypeptidase T
MSLRFPISVKFFAPILLASIVLGGALGFSNLWTRPTSMVIVSRADFRKHADEFRRRGIDVAGQDILKDEVYLYVDTKDRADLLTLGLDLGEMHPAGSLQGSPDEEYKTPNEVNELLSKYASQFPQLATLSSFGKSLEGRDLQVLKITNGSGIKPTILFNGMHHAREVMTTEVVLDIADYLLSNYGRDPKVTAWVDNYEIYLVPMFNVDGNNKVWNEDNMWRKNTRGRFGVDLNRNYPYGWNSCNGSSPYEMAQDYRGPSAASEPETRALMGLVAQVRPVFDISFHSFSELVIYPYGCGEHTEQKDVVEPIGQKIASLLPRDDGRGTYSAGTPPDLLYPADGGDMDWMYHEYNVLPYVIELNSASLGFQPSYSKWRDKTVTKMRASWMYLLDRMSESSIEGRIEGRDPVTVEVQGRSVKVRPDGYFRLIMNPGTYDLTFKSAAGVLAQKRVTVGNSPATVQFN